MIRWKRQPEGESTDAMANVEVGMWVQPKAFVAHGVKGYGQPSQTALVTEFSNAQPEASMSRLSTSEQSPVIREVRPEN